MTYIANEDVANYYLSNSDYKYYDSDAFKYLMAELVMLVFAPEGQKYSAERDTDYALYVRRADIMLMNVYLDGVRIPYGSYRTERLKNGMFRFVLSADLMKSLGKGAHSLRLNFDGLDDIEIVIEVE